LISEEASAAAIKALELAAMQGEQWAILAIADRVSPKLKAITPPDSLDGELLRAKIKEMAELAAEVAELRKLVEAQN
jgi:hypothetical protein